MFCVPGSGGHDDQAHPPIHPTRYSAGESGWSPDKARLYEFIVRHFLACGSVWHCLYPRQQSLVH